MPEKNCPICQRNDRAEIENAILNMTTDSVPLDIETLAERFGLGTTELKNHALFHTPLVDEDDVDAINEYTSALECGEIETPAVAHSPEATHAKRDSLTRRMKLREADMLMSVANEYMVTLKAMGRRINKLAQTSSIDIEEEDNQVRLARLLTKPMTDLYIGLGGEIRQTVKATAELDRMLNGPDESNANSGLTALAAAIAGSRDAE